MSKQNISLTTLSLADDLIRKHSDNMKYIRQGKAIISINSRHFESIWRWLSHTVSGRFRLVTWRTPSILQGGMSKTKFICPSNRTKAKTEHLWCRVWRMWITRGQKNAKRALSGLRSANYGRRWNVSPWRQTGSRCISIYPHNGHSATLFPTLEGGSIIWISGLLVPILPACVSHHLKCNINSCSRPAVDNQNRGWSYGHPFWRATNQNVSVNKQQL